ncbi:MAG: DNA mismatch repair endonuclease MutL [Clostridia bacterium]|nr:DNA mismatch repair endonuclease MutL [Clostridia bacterium]
MARIKILPQDIADKIAAGEVAERPSAVVKELVENSIDAGATQITVEIKRGGISYISVEDNGCGIPFDEAEFAFIRHATSKLLEIDDLFRIKTMGFRGEALASICAVSDVEVITKEQGADIGARLVLKHGEVVKKEEIACNSGTVMLVENLFASVPARMKFLKKDATEAGYVTDVLSRIALSKPHIAFKYICDGKEVFSTAGDGNLKNAILNIYGIDHAKGVIEVDHMEHGVKVVGVVGKSELSRGNRTRQTLFVNGRYIKNHVVSKIVEEAYRNELMTGRFPFFVLDVVLSPELVDVNVHPAKTEIKFANEKEVYDIVYHAVKNALYNKTAENFQQTSTIEKKKSTGFAPGKNGGYTYEQKEALDKNTVMGFLKNTVLKETSTYALREPSRSEIFEDFATNKLDEIRDTLPKSESVEETNEKAIPQTKSEGELFETDIQALDKAVVSGQVFDTYVIVQKGDSMFLIDQHAAHERKRFEILRRDYEMRGVSGQMLLVPIVMDADGLEMQIVREKGEILENMGFGIEEFGKNSLIIRQTPFVADDEDIKALALEVIEILAEARPLGLLSFEERILDTISCKYAIKANKKLSMLEMEALVKDVEELEREGITTCPHGRPMKIEFTKREIEKMFKRIV